MTTTTAVVNASDLTEIAEAVWQSFLALPLTPDPRGAQALPLGGYTLTGCAHVAGEWRGSVMLECDAALARYAAGVMFDAPPASLSEDDVSDALGELTNMIGGNVKGLLPAPSTLSVPSVSSGDPCTVRVPGAVLVDQVALVCAPGAVHVSLWESHPS